MRKEFIVFLFLLFFYGNIFSQNNDVRLWTSINLEKRISKKFSFLFTETVRFSENISQAGTIFSDFGLRYKFKKKWRITGHYRFSKFNNGDHTFSNGDRFYIDLAYKQKTLFPITVVLRARYQSQYTDMFTSENGLIPQKLFRIKGSLVYELEKRYKPYISVEFFYQLSNTIHKNQFINSRYSGGLIYEINKRTNLDIYGLLIRGMNSKNPNRFYTVGLELNHLF